MTETLANTITVKEKDVEVFTMQPDGSVKFGPGFTTTEAAARTFWEALGELNPLKKELSKLLDLLGQARDLTWHRTTCPLFEGARPEDAPRCTCDVATFLSATDTVLEKAGRA